MLSVSIIVCGLLVALSLSNTYMCTTYCDRPKHKHMSLIFESETSYMQLKYSLSKRNVST